MGVIHRGLHTRDFFKIFYKVCLVEVTKRIENILPVDHLFFLKQPANGIESNNTGKLFGTYAHIVQKVALQVAFRQGHGTGDFFDGHMPMLL